MNNNLTHICGEMPIDKTIYIKDNEIYIVEQIDLYENTKQIVDYKYCPYCSEVLIQINNNTTTSKIFTKRECEIIKLIINGYTYKQIAKMLYVTHSTINSHMRNLRDKLKVRTKTQIVCKYLNIVNK